MRLVTFESSDRVATPGILTEEGVISLSGVAASLEDVIPRFEDLRPALERLVADGVPLRDVRLLAPLPRPGKILPDVSAEWQFVPEAELGLVIHGPAKSVTAANWRSAVFGYTCVVDVMAQGDTMFGRDYWLAKADTLGPLGPCIVTADEVGDPNALRVQSFLNGAPLQEYSTSDAEFSVPRLVEFATTVMTLYSGDIIACGTPPQDLRPLNDGDSLDVEIEKVGRLSLRVTALAGSHL